MTQPIANLRNGPRFGAPVNTHDTSNLTCSGGGAREENGWYQGVKSCCLVSRPKETIRLPLLGGNPGNAGLSLPASS